MDRQELQRIARDAMRANGLEPDFPAAARAISEVLGGFVAPPGYA